MKKKSLKGFLLSIFLSVSVALFSQNVGINTSGTIPSTNAILDLNTGNAKNLGIIIPRVVLGSSLTTFSPPMANAPTGLDSGMMVYNWQATNQPVGYYCWNGSTWVNVSGLGLSWNVGGNAGTTPGTNYAGTSDANAFVIKTNATERMRFLSGGGAGIGTLTPQSAVDVNGNMSIGSYAGVNAAPTNGVIISGSVGIATANPARALEVGGTTNTIRVDGLQSGSTFNIANGSASLTAYMMFANTNGDVSAMAAGATGNSLIWTATGPQWGNPVTSATAWQIVGNSNITDGTNFLGTTNTVPINFQINGNTAGRIDMNKFNTFLGYLTTPITTTGTNNAAIGYHALNANNTASFNTAMGSGALTANNAANNTAVGYNALTANNTGTGNTGIGYEPLLKATSGTFNTAIGYLPMGNGITTGSFNAAMGYEALFGNTSGSDNVGIGYEALFTNATSSNNTAVGYEALLSSTTGTGNTGIGYEPLLRATNGSENFAGGYLPMANGIVTGSFNTALGYEPMYNLSSGSENTAIGYLPMGSGVTTGIFNNAIGGYPLYLTTSGGYNNAMGYEAGYEITTTSYNNAIGYLAGFDNTGTANNNLGYYAGYENFGSENNAIGYEAGYEITGFYNNAFGYLAGGDEITGSENNAMGYYAGYLTEGTGNNAFGMYAGEDNYGYSYNNEIGYFAGEITEGNYNNVMGYEAAINCYGSENNLLGYFAGYYNSGTYNNALGAFALYGDINFGTGSYNNALGYQAMYSNGTAAYNNAIGYQAMYNISSGMGNSAIGDSALRSITTGGENIAIGSEALMTTTSGSYNTALGYKANVSLATATNATAIGSGAIATASNQVVLGNTAVTQTEFSGSLMPYYGAAYNAGAAGQVMTSQGAGTSPQWTTISVPVTGANNGLTLNSGTVQLGGPLVQNASIMASSGNYNMNYDLGTGALAGTGTFSISNGGSSNTYFSIVNSGGSGNPGQIGIGTATPNASAALDVTSTSSGLLFPRLDSAQIAAIATPTNGLVLFNTSTNCLQLFAGAWVSLSCGCTPLPAPGAISGPSSFCAAASGQTYSCGTVVGAVGYIWSMSPSVVGSSIVGSGTTATVNFAATPTTYTISVADSNATHCISGYTTYTVLVSATPSAPATPSGNTSPVVSTSYTYTIAPVLGATSYTWSVSSTNGTITAGQGTTSATILFSSTPATMNICVYASENGCNSPTSCLSVTSTNCLHGSLTYSYVSNATQTWSVPICITSVTVSLWGAGGSSGWQSGFTDAWCGGSGAYYNGVLSGAALAGSTLTLYVPSGGAYVITGALGGAGGWPGGGTAGLDNTFNEYGGAGGGYAAIAVGATYYVVAGGGGGGGSTAYGGTAYGGGGGATTGGSGISSVAAAGTGGTIAAGGTAGASGVLCDAGANGTALTGGVGGGLPCASCCSNEYGGGGGGGGWYGGGGGGDEGSSGGGGSSYPSASFTSGGITFTPVSNIQGTMNSATSGSAVAPGSPPVGIGSGNIAAAGGNGYITITY